MDPRGGDQEFLHLRNGRPIASLRRPDQDSEMFSNSFRTGVCFAFVFFAILIILITAADSKRTSTIIFAAIFSFFLLVGFFYWRFQQRRHAEFLRTNDTNSINNHMDNSRENQLVVNDDDGLRLILELHRNLQTIQLLNQRHAQHQIINSINNTNNNNNRGLAEDEIAKLPKFIYKAPEDKIRIKRFFDEDETDDPDSESNEITKLNSPSSTEIDDKSIKSSSSPTSKNDKTLISNGTITYSENGTDFIYQLPVGPSHSNLSSSTSRHNVLQVNGHPNEKPEYCLECSICLGSYVSGEVNIKLHCGHMFHKPCLEECKSFILLILLYIIIFKLLCFI